jgi:hypothetical protein
MNGSNPIFYSSVILRFGLFLINLARYLGTVLFTRGKQTLVIKRVYLPFQLA